jgi:hypothetical protein
MFNEDTKNLIDYAYQDNGTAFRDSLYNAIHDKVSAHIESKKQEIAAGLMGQQEEAIEESKDDDDDDGAYELDDPKHPTWAKRYLEKADSKRKSDKEVSEDVALEEGRKPSPITGTRKIASYEGDHGHTAEVRHSREYNEYQVHHYKNGVHQGEGPISYHGDDKEEAHDNAKYEVGMQPEIIKKK